MEAQRSLLHLDPQGQDVIVFIDGRHQFIHVLILLRSDFCLTDKTFARQLVRLVGQTIYIRINAIDNGQAGFLLQIAPLVVGYVPLVDVALFLQPTPFVAQGNGSHTILQRPLHIGVQYLPCSHLIAPHLQMRKRQPAIFDTEIFCTKKFLYIVGYGTTDGIGHFLLCLGIGRDRSGYLLAHIQQELQPSQMLLVACLRTPIEEPEEDKHGYDT